MLAMPQARVMVYLYNDACMSSSVSKNNPKGFIIMLVEPIILPMGLFMPKQHNWVH